MEHPNLGNKFNNPDYLPQSEDEWLKFGKFETKVIPINGNEIRCAVTVGQPQEAVITMVGGIPRDKERRGKLPLINKLYGHLALKMLEHKKSAVLYNQPGTGGSSGNWDIESMESRTDTLVQVTEHFSKELQSSNVQLVGTSAGAYMAVGAAERLQSQGIAVSKLVLISPAAYPKEIQNMPYGEEFKNTIHASWNVAESPIFEKLKNFVLHGGSVAISFFENDDPPIPKHIQDYYKNFSEELSQSGGNIKVTIIKGVAHNFRRMNTSEGENAVDNNSIRETARSLVNFLTN